jgi:isopentenyldiphosphate isomerase
VIGALVGDRIAVVDADNRFLRWEHRTTIHRDHLIHRTVHILLFDSHGRLILQRRNRRKATFPGCWDVSACGHVEEADYPSGPDERLDEVYAETARRELHEELGVHAQLSALGHFPPMEGIAYEQMRLFRGTSDGPYRLQEEEVAEVRPFTASETDALLSGAEPLTLSLPFFVRWIRDRGLWIPPAGPQGGGS